MSRSIGASDTLAGLRVLVTRPRDRADALIAAITAAGGVPEHIPLLAVAPLTQPQDEPIRQRTRRHLLELDRYRRVIAISVNAVHYGVQCLADFWPQWPQDIVWYGIGEATLAEFARWDIHAHGGGAAMDSESLLALPELQRIAGDRILILRGVGGRETLATILRERGAQVDYAECYRRVEPVLDAGQQRLLQQAPFDAVCVNSGDTLRHLARHAGAALRAKALIVPSTRVAAAARDAGFEQIVVARNAGSEATLAALQTIKVN